MADNKRISDLETTNVANINDLMELSQYIAVDEYQSKKIGLSFLASSILETFLLGRLDTTSKSIVGAINEVLKAATEIENYDFTPTNATGTLNFRRVGKVVHVYGNIDGLSSTATQVNLGTIKFKSANTYAILQATAKTGAYNSSVGTVWITTGGAVTLYKTSGTTGCYVFGTFICT